MTDETTVKVFKGPFDNEQAHALLRLQVAMWLPARCAVCEKLYLGVDDWIARDPLASPTFPNPDTGFIDRACFKPVYKTWFQAMKGELSDSKRP